CALRTTEQTARRAISSASLAGQPASQVQARDNPRHTVILALQPLPWTVDDDAQITWQDLDLDRWFWFRPLASHLLQGSQHRLAEARVHIEVISDNLDGIDGAVRCEPACVFLQL